MGELYEDDLILYVIWFSERDFGVRFSAPQEIFNEEWREGNTLQQQFSSFLGNECSKDNAKKGPDHSRNIINCLQSDHTQNLKGQQYRLAGRKRDTLGQITRSKLTILFAFFELCRCERIPRYERSNNLQCIGIS